MFNILTNLCLASYMLYYKMEKDNIFLRNQVKTLTVVGVVFVLILLSASEMFLRAKYGFGNPVIYDSNPLYGFRPLPEQETVRFNGKRIYFNNLGLRAMGDWDENPDGKVLFLGDSVTYGGSYISNEDLFSTLALSNIDGFTAGNAGVNAWGVDNVYGLVVESEFTPATIYVSVFPEGDFYRGLTRLHGLPYNNVKPSLALQEILMYFAYKINNKRYINWTKMASEKTIITVIRKSVARLSEMDKYLKAKGYIHLVFITPSKGQVYRNAERDLALEGLLNEYGVEAVYLTDSVKDVVQRSVQELYYDEIHLNEAGHRIWGEIIGNYIVMAMSKTKSNRTDKELINTAAH